MSADTQLMYTEEVMTWIAGWFDRHVRPPESSNETIVRVSRFPIYSIRPHLRSVYTLFLFLNTAVFAAGLSLNGYLIYRVIRKKLYRDHLIIYLTNIAVSDIMQLTFVLPYTLCVSLFEYWFLGRALCYVGPWIQHLPSSISTLTHLLMALHRYRQIMCPLKEPLSFRVCLIAVWIVAACLNLPSSIFHRFIDVESFWREHLKSQEIGAHPLPLVPEFFENVTLCVQAVKQSLRDYARAIFIVMFALPFVVTTFLYVRSSTELSSSLNRRLEYAESLEEMEAIAPLAIVGRERASSSDGNVDDPRARQLPTTSVTSASHSSSRRTTEIMRSADLDYDSDSESCPPVHTAVETSARLKREKNVHHCLILMTVVYVIAWSPLRILTLSNPLLTVDTDNAAREEIEQKLDITYLVFLLFTHLVTCLNPVVIIKRLPYGTDTTIGRRTFGIGDIEMIPTATSASNSSDNRTTQKKKVKKMSQNKPVNSNNERTCKIEEKAPAPVVSYPPSQPLVGKQCNSHENDVGGLRVL